MSDSSTYCHNCEAPALGKYCSECGQRTSVHKVTFKETFQDFWDFVFSVNAPLFNTFKLLVIAPGKLLREYLEGKRRRYYKPVAFFILMTVIYLITRAVINYDPFGNTTVQVSDNSQSQLLTRARDFMLLNIDKLLFVFVFTMSLLLKLFFYRKRSLAEYIAISFYLIGMYTVLTTLNMFYVQYINPNFQFLAMLAMLVYFCYALVSFFQKGKIIVIIKSLVIFITGFISYGLIAFAISFLIIYLKQL